METPYYSRVAKGWHTNLLQRRALIKAGCSKKRIGNAIWHMCAEDPLFFLNLFIYANNSKDVAVQLDGTVMSEEAFRPYISWRIQDDVIAAVYDAFGKYDVPVKKSRDMGGTWSVCGVFFHRWLFRAEQNMICLSRNEDYVDKRGDEKSIYWKFDFMLRWLPPFLKPAFTRSDKLLINNDNGSILAGEAATGQAGRGGKYVAALWDEVAAWDISNGWDALAALSGATNSRIFVSTMGSPVDVFSKKCISAKAAGKLVTMKWSDHPHKAAGLYIARGNGALDIIDKKFKFPPKYDFKLDGKLRSPYFDQFERENSPRICARELEMEEASDTLFFDRGLVEKLVAQAIEPSDQGELAFSEYGEPGTFTLREQGQVRSWVPFVNQKPHGISGDIFVAGADISTGTGMSNSVLTIASAKSGRVYCEVVTRNTPPSRFAAYCIAVCRLFNNALLGWEAPGPGREFGARVLELGYANIWYSRPDKKLAPSATDTPGWWSNDDNKRVLLSEYEVALAQKKFINVSRESLLEMLEFGYVDGRVTHQKALQTPENRDTGSGVNHGDMCISAALCSMLVTAAGENGGDQQSETAPDVPNPGDPGYELWCALNGIKQESGSVDSCVF